MLVDFDDLFVRHALEHGHVSAEQVAAVQKIQQKQAKKGRRYYLAQLLIQKRVISTEVFLEIEDALEQKLTRHKSAMDFGNETTVLAMGDSYASDVKDLVKNGIFWPPTSQIVKLVLLCSTVSTLNPRVGMVVTVGKWTEPGPSWSL